MLCEGDFPETISTKNKFASNCSYWTLTSMLLWSDGYLSRERVLSVTQPGTAVALLQFIPVIPSTNATSERLFTVLTFTTSQKLLAHHDAAGTSELSDAAARSQGMNRWSGHASSVNIIHWRVGASVRHLCSVYKFISAE